MSTQIALPYWRLRIAMFASTISLALLCWLWPQSLFADHLIITANPPQVTLQPGATAEIQIHAAGDPDAVICLDAFLEALVPFSFSFPSGRCSEGADFAATLLVAAGPDVPPGDYDVVVTASIVVSGDPVIHDDIIVRITVTSCTEWVVTLRDSSGETHPGSTIATTIHATAVDPPDATWTFQATDAPADIAVLFNPSSFTGAGSATAAIAVGPSVPAGTYVIPLTPFCNGMALSPLTYSLRVPAQPTATLTATATPSPTATDTATETPTATDTATATPTPTETLPPTTAPSNTPTETPTETPTATASVTHTATASPTPSPTPSPTATRLLPDLTITGIEVTQAIQNLANQAPLIAEKMTVVRVYIRSDAGVFPNVSAQLHGKRNGVPLPASPRLPRRAIPARPTGITNAMRNNLNDSFVFMLPNSWTRGGQVTLEVALNHDRVVPERDYTNNTLATNVIFQPTPPLKMWLVRIQHTAAGVNLTPTWNDFWPAHDWLLGVYPVHQITVFDGGVMSYGGTLSTLAGMYDLVNKLWWRDFWTVESLSLNGDENSVWYGLVHQNVNMPVTGMAYDIGVENAIGEADPLWGGFNMAHEIGHTLGRRHINCGGPLGVDAAYPYNPSWIADGTPLGYYGFNTRRTAVIGPPTAADFMSYCWGPPSFAGAGPPWVSDYTYRGLWNTIRNNFSLSAQSSTAASQSQETVAVTGLINTATLTATLDHLYRTGEVQITYQPGDGPFTLVFEDNMGISLFHHAFDVARVEAEESDLGRFAMALPFPAQTARIVLKHDQTTLATVPVSANTPQVTILAPNGGEVVTETVELAWAAEDLDGDSLRYTVQYSPDQGNTWQAVAVDLDAAGYVLDTHSLPGAAQALIRVIATDGVNTGEDTSDAPFMVETKPPALYLIQPQPGAPVAPDAPLVLVGYGIDPEDGPLDSAALTWSSDRDGPLGAGATLISPALSPGEHTLTLAAADRDGNETLVATTLLVAHRLFLPIVQRATP